MNGNSILGGYQSDFARNCKKEGRSIGDLIAEVVEGTLARSGIGPETIETIHVANAFGQLYTGQGHLGAMPATVVPGLWGRPAMRHEGACASGSLATLAAMAELEAGRYDCALVLGAEIESRSRRGGRGGQAAPPCRSRDRNGPLWPSTFDRIAARTTNATASTTAICARSASSTSGMQGQPECPDPRLGARREELLR
jgi:acetyl-CoA C-acetyltransferase